MTFPLLNFSNPPCQIWLQYRYNVWHLLLIEHINFNTTPCTSAEREGTRKRAFILIKAPWMNGPYFWIFSFEHRYFSKYVGRSVWENCPLPHSECWTVPMCESPLPHPTAHGTFSSEWDWHLHYNLLAYILAARYRLSYISCLRIAWLPNPSPISSIYRKIYLEVGVWNPG